MLRRALQGLSLLALWLALPSGASAQWIGYPTPGIPRLPNGQPNLSAPAPKTADGHPDLSGIWVTTSGKWLVNIAADGIEVPWTPPAKALFDERQANNGKDRPSGRCISHGVTDFHALTTPTKFIQTPAVTVDSVRVVQPLSSDHDRRPSAAERSRAGVARIFGRQVGRQHVRRRDATDSVEKTWLDDGGHPHSDALRLTERFTRPDFGHMNIEITIDDPMMYTKPWTVTMTKRLDRGRRADRVDVRERERHDSHGWQVDGHYFGKFEDSMLDGRPAVCRRTARATCARRSSITRSAR